MTKPVFMFLCWLALIQVSVSVLAADTGFIQVKCVPGIQILLDGNLRGVTDVDVGGLIMQNVSVGSHEVKAAKPGFQTQTFSVTVSARKISSVQVEPFVPKITISQRDKNNSAQTPLKVGTVQVRSSPVQCTVTIAVLGIKNLCKTKDRWQADGVPVGKYTIVGETGEKRLAHEIYVTEGTIVPVFFDFVNGHVTTRNESTAATAVPTAAASATTGSSSGPTPGQPWMVPGMNMPFVWIRTLGAWAGQHETTNSEFRQFKEDHDSGDYEDETLNRARQPVVRVSYEDAEEFTEWLTRRERQAGRLTGNWSYRLPSANEWTTLARCGEDRVYPWGPDWPPTHGNYSDKNAKTLFGFDCIADYQDGTSVTCDVEKSGTNEWGFLGVGGNVWEWTREGIRDKRAARGASWYDSNKEELQCDYRDNSRVTSKHYYTGFRVFLANVDDTTAPAD